MVDRDGLIWAGGIGKADLSTGKEVTEDTLFRVGSTSKSFTALSVLTLVEQDRLDLNTPIKELIPQFEFSNPWSDITPSQQPCYWNTPRALIYDYENFSD